jgi:hypothetical protein
MINVCDCETVCLGERECKGLGCDWIIRIRKSRKVMWRPWMLTHGGVVSYHRTWKGAYACAMTILSVYHRKD